MKNYFLKFLILTLIFLVFSCKRDYNNPYDSRTDSSNWAPDNLDVTIEGNNQVRITWSQNEERIDGFILENDNNPSSNPVFINKNLRTYIDNSLFNIQNCGVQFNYTLKAYAGENYSDGIIYENCLPSLLPLIATSTVSNITLNSALCGGNVTNSGSSTVTSKGICWSTSPNPTNNNVNFMTVSGYGTGPFTSNLTNLISNTIYYVRAYATNSYGTSYGNEVSFTTQNLFSPILTTVAISNISPNSVQTGGNITDDGGAAITQRGVCWSTSPNPTNSNVNFMTIDGSGSGNFISNVNNLNPNTTFYLRAYATNSVGTSYGNEVSFTTQSLSIPTIITSVASNISTSSIQSGGNIINDGGAYISTRGVCWSTSPNPTNSNVNYVTINGTGTGTFISNVNNLNPSTTYYLRAYATNSLGTAYGNEISFNTQSLSTPSLSTATISNISSNSVQSGGNITSDGGATISQKGVCWSTSPNPTNSNVNFMTIDGTGTGNFISNVTNLNPNTTYYLRAYATNSIGTAYGNEVSFTTLCNLPVVNTVSVNASYHSTHPTLGDFYNLNMCGVVTNEGTSPISQVIITYCNSPPCGGGSPPGGYPGLNNNFCMSPLQQGTGTYQIQASATNACGTSYGSVLTITF